jgi:agmatinase
MGIQRRGGDVVSWFFGAGTKTRGNANASVLGLCWDKGSSFRKGAAKAPKIIRKYTSSKLYNSFTETGLNIKDHWRIYDMGDVSPSSIVEAVSGVRACVGKHANTKLKIFLGGDHSITYVTLKALKETALGSWGLVYLDAHLDLYESYGGDPYSHACTVRRLIDDGVVNPRDVVQVGVRAAPAQQLNYAKKNEMKILSTSAVCRMTGKETASIIKTSLCNVDFVYVSFDVDVLDPAFAPGVGNPEGAGVSPRKLIEILHEFNELNIRAFDVVEANPDYDCAGVTFISISKVVREMLGVVAATYARDG